MEKHSLTNWSWRGRGGEREFRFLTHEDKKAFFTNENIVTKIYIRGLYCIIINLYGQEKEEITKK